MLIKMIFVGVDYSVNSPGITVLFDDGTFHSLCFLQEPPSGPVDPRLTYFVRDNSSMSTFEKYISNRDLLLLALSVLPAENTIILFEDYSFGSKGNITMLAENCGIAKLSAFEKGYTIELCSPQSVKKNAVGKGTASKEEMVEKFHELVDIDFSFLRRKSDKKVIEDIADSYHIAQKARADYLEKVV